MEPILLSLLFYLYVISVCELSKQALLAVTRNFDVRLVVLEILGTLQICACVFEGGVVMKYYGPLGLWVTICFLSFAHGFTAFTAAIGHPSAVIEGLIRGNFSIRTGLMRLAAEIIASILTFQVVKIFWAYSWSSDHSSAYGQTSPCALKYKKSFLVVSITEIILTAILRFCFLEIAKRRISVYTRAAKSVTLATLLVIGSLISGPTFLNPAQALGRFLVCEGVATSQHLTSHWLCTTVGWCLGSLIHGRTRKAPLKLD